MAIEYSFTTKWKTSAPLDDVWEAIRLSLEWPMWWKDFISVTESIPGDVNGIGSIRTYTLKSPTSYKLAFDLLLTHRIDRKLLKGTANGDLTGTGEWHFDEKDGFTFIECRWNVCTTKGWMNLLAFILQPVFKYNHRMVMKNGAKCLQNRLSATVTDIS